MENLKLKLLFDLLPILNNPSAYTKPLNHSMKSEVRLRLFVVTIEL